MYVGPKKQLFLLFSLASTEEKKSSPMKRDRSETGEMGVGWCY